MPELEGQRITGTPMTERDCFHQAIYHINGLRNCLRGLALLRGDIRWLVPVRILDKMEDSVKRMITLGSRLVNIPYQGS